MRTYTIGGREKNALNEGLLPLLHPPTHESTSCSSRSKSLYPIWRSLANVLGAVLEHLCLWLRGWIVAHDHPAPVRRQGDARPEGAIIHGPDEVRTELRKRRANARRALAAFSGKYGAAARRRAHTRECSTHVHAKQYVHIYMKFLRQRENLTRLHAFRSLSQ